jgi:hypothetical protein
VAAWPAGASSAAMALVTKSAVQSLFFVRVGTDAVSDEEGPQNQLPGRTS